MPRATGSPALDQDVHLQKKDMCGACTDIRVKTGTYISIEKMGQMATSETWPQTEEYN